MRDDPESPVQRAMSALERIAVALERQADVMEADVADADEEVIAVTDARQEEATVVRLYGTTLSKILDTSNAFERSRGLRELASKMIQHGKETKAQARQR